MKTAWKTTISSLTGFDYKKHVLKKEDFIMNENKKLVGEGVGFERIRRITGYLVGTLDRFNNAKAAEVKDRVKHSLGTGKGDLEHI